jgi:hypothetical protein
MKKLAIVFAVGAAALMGGSVANADSPAKARTSTDVTQSSVSTDISAHRRYRHWRRHHHHWGYHHYRPYYRSYGYAPGRYYGHRYYGHRYYGGGPGVTFSFGTGGYRW